MAAATDLDLRDLMAFSLVAKSLNKRRDAVPENWVDHFGGHFALHGTIATGGVSIRKLPGDAKRVLANALRLMTKLQLEALGDLIALERDPPPEFVSMAQSFVDSIAGEAICRPALRGFLSAERIE